MTIEQIVILILAVVLAIAVVGLIVLLVRYQSLKKKVSSGDRLAPEVIVKDGVRYSKDPAIEKDGIGTVSHAEGDFVLAAGKTYRAKKDGELLPGAYTVLAANDATHSFKLRVGGFVRNFVHGDALVLNENEEVCAVSVSVILR
ncbi:MAG TPA: hypothetical protein H9670_05355 [Firmicutes bacterium]|nr:hypothetical protein [Bacillota bacterium]